MVALRRGLRLCPARGEVADVVHRLGAIDSSPGRAGIVDPSLLFGQPADGAEKRPLADPARRHVECELAATVFEVASLDWHDHGLGPRQGLSDRRRNLVVQAKARDLSLDRDEPGFAVPVLLLDALGAGLLRVNPAATPAREP
jgi:hypothetical protein